MRITPKRLVAAAAAATGLAASIFVGAAAAGAVPGLGADSGAASQDPPLRPDKERVAQAERAQQARAEARSPAPKRPDTTPTSCPEPDATPVIEGPSDAVRGVRVHVATQTRVVYGRSVYQVWTGTNGEDGAAAGQGTIFVVEGPRDGCAASDDEVAKTSLNDTPGVHGAVTMTSVSGPVVQYTNEDGTSGRFNLETKRFG